MSINHKSKRLAAAMVAMTAVAAGMFATPTDALAPNTAPNGLVTMTPANGTGNSTFGFLVPGGAACAGDSGSGGYRVQSYITNTIDSSQLTFNAAGEPVAPSGYAVPLSNGGTPYSNQNTANATVAGGTGAILVAGTVFDGLNTLFPQPTTSGVYKIGVACTLGTAMTNFYEKNIAITVTGGVVTAYGNFAVTTPPTVVSPLVAGSGSLSGTLTAPSPAPTPAVSSYTITATPTVGAPVVITQPGLAFAFSGLTNGVTYSVGATAFNGANSAPSAAVTGTPFDVNARPPVVLNPVVLGPVSATVSWIAPAITPDAGPFYNVIVTNTVTGLPAVGVTVSALTAASTSVSLTTLTAGASLTVSITPVYALPATSTPAATPTFIVLGNSLIIQDITVTRPQGALVLTQVCGVYGALDLEPASPGFAQLAAKGATTAPGAPTGPTLGANGAGGVDPNYTNGLYPSPASPTYPTHCNISLGTATLVTTGAEAGQYYAASGQINQVTVSDTRDGQNGWTLNGTMSPFVNSTNSAVTFGNNSMGWTPKVNGFSVGQVVTAAARVLPNAPGLVAPTTLASATTASLGIAQMDARLRLLIPVSAPSGLYNATLTFSVA